MGIITFAAYLGNQIWALFLSGLLKKKALTLILLFFFGK